MRGKLSETLDDNVTQNVEVEEKIENIENIEEKNEEKSLSLLSEVEEEDVEEEVRRVEITEEKLLDEGFLEEVFNVYGNKLSRLMVVLNYILSKSKEYSAETQETVKNRIKEMLSDYRKKSYLVQKEEESIEKSLMAREMVISKSRDIKNKLLLAQREKEYDEINKNINEIIPEDDLKKIIDKFKFKRDGSLDNKNVYNYDLIMQNDPYFKEHLRFNEFSQTVEFDGEKIRNGILLDIISYMDRAYNLHEQDYIWNALNRPGNLESYHPIKDIIEEKEWDGVPRIDTFFKEICDIKDTTKDMGDYHREVARMLFYGGITRLYHPGAKFDYMIIFKGPQGTCKSTLARTLALDENAYSEVTTIDGQEAIECISGAWICEFAELLAMTRARELEAIKAFITRQADKYRPPYAHVAEIQPRNCIFIGTTNDSQFMSDVTGNRRYLPVEINIDAEWFFENLNDFVKPYILECWREALYKFRKGLTYTTISPKYFTVLEMVRAIYTEDDPLEGLIRGYLDKLEPGAKVCSLELYVNCCNGIRNRFSNRDSRQIAAIMNKCKGFTRMPERAQFEEYGQQRYWLKHKD